jgi:translation elongation factor EF-1alpha
MKDKACSICSKIYRYSLWMNNKPLRISIHETYDIFRTGTVLAGKILSGTLRVGMKLKIMPGNYVT